MSTDTAYAALMLLTIAMNYMLLLMALPRKYRLGICIAAMVGFTAVFYAVLFITGNMSNTFGGFRGLVHLPLLLLLFDCAPFQKTFATLMVMTFSSFQMALSSAIVALFVPMGSEQYNMLALLLAMLMYSVYIALIALFGRQIFARLFVGDPRVEWALYSLGAMFAYSVMMFANNRMHGIEAIMVLLFCLWSFVILCFAIINTREKAMKSYEAELARSIIATGSDHYQKMNEMYDELRVMRHDYKYHLDTLHELLRGDARGEMEHYLSDIQAQLQARELPSFCANSVLNALLTSYAQRCARNHIRCRIEISMPKDLAVPNYEMCIILGNLMENAVEACLRQSGGRFIEMVINTQGSYLAVMVKNSCDADMPPQHTHPPSRKTGGGLGHRSIRAVAARYGGELMTERDEHTFTAYVLLRS